MPDWFIGCETPSHFATFDSSIRSQISPGKNVASEHFLPIFIGLIHRRQSWFKLVLTSAVPNFFYHFYSSCIMTWLLFLLWDLNHLVSILKTYLSYPPAPFLVALGKHFVALITQCWHCFHTHTVNESLQRQMADQSSSRQTSIWRLE